MKSKILSVGAVALMLSVGAGNAATIDWTTWSNVYSQSATAGAASGTSAFGDVSYTGEVESVVADYPSWTPASSYTDSLVGNAPSQSGGIVQLFGGNGDVTNTITFAKPVTDPIIAIWSLGAAGHQAEFDFTSGTVVLQGGGPSAEYGGSALTAAGNDVFGEEGNGTIEILGTFRSISWTNPVYENWYGFTVGAASTVPEPAAWALMLGALACMGAALRARRRSAIA